VYMHGTSTIVTLATRTAVSSCSLIPRSVTVKTIPVMGAFSSAVTFILLTHLIMFYLISVVINISGLLVLTRLSLLLILLLLCIGSAREGGRTGTLTPPNYSAADRNGEQSGQVSASDWMNDTNARLLES